MIHPICLTIDWRDADCDIPEAQQEAFTQSVFRSLRSHSAIQTIARVPDPDVPTGGMGAQWLWNILTAEIPGDGLREACREALGQLEGKPMKFKLEVNQQTKIIEVEDVSPADFDRVLDKLVAAAKEINSAS
ncbi:MAG: hypothetical protein HC800_19900 [Phormidesmis sp. RL_2_1]|nr:hypothetical protein [Phormidesmis sp. RL_2_1]